MKQAIIIKSPLTPSHLQLLYQYCIQRAKEPYGPDPQISGTPAYYMDPMMKALELMLLPTMEKTVGLELWPTYTYWRFYKFGDELHLHTDRESCEISASLHVGHEGDDWPIFINDGKEKEYTIKPGEMLIYDGPQWPHWRPEYKGGRYAQVFLHYVDKNGAYKRWKFDKHDSF